MGSAKPTPETLDARNERDAGMASRLCRTVIYRAIVDAFALPGRGGSTVRETLDAQDWLTTGGEDFALVCELAGIDAGTISARAKEWCREEWPRHRFDEWKTIIREMEQRRDT